MIYRHPAVLANMAATIDIISHGRLELGLGAGWNQMECDAYGIDLPPLKERFDRFDEGVEAHHRAADRGDRPTSPGEYFKLTDAWCEPKPVQRPHPPIAIGGNGPKRTLRAAARWAQQWNVITSESGGVARSLKDSWSSAATRSAATPNEITCSVNVRIDPDPTRSPARSPLAAAYGEAGVDLAS